MSETLFLAICSNQNKHVHVQQNVFAHEPLSADEGSRAKTFCCVCLDCYSYISLNKQFLTYMYMYNNVTCNSAVSEEVGNGQVLAQNCFVSKTIPIVSQYKVSSQCSSPIVRLTRTALRSRVKKVISSLFSK